MSSKFDLQKYMSEGSSLRELRNHQGWSEFEKMLKDMYIDALESLALKDDVDARARIQVISDIVATVNDKIRLGKQAAEELRDGLFIDKEG